MDCRAVCLVDGPADDYEIWDEYPPDDPRRHETVPYVRDLRIPGVGEASHAAQKTPDRGRYF